MSNETTTEPRDLRTTFEDVFDGLAFESLQILYDRQRKYGPENIRRQGLWGLLTRIKDDKIARLQSAFNGVIRKGVIELDDLPDRDDETVEDTLFDIANYALIMIAVKRGVWGFPMREETGEVETLAAAHPNGVPQLMTPDEVREFFESDPVEEPDEETTLPGRLVSDDDLDALREWRASDDGMPDRETAARRVEEARLARNLGGMD